MTSRERAPLGLDDDEEDVDLSQFTPKQGAAKPKGTTAAKTGLRDLAKEQGFVSRQAGIRRRRRRRTGRNEQINIKTTADYADRFYAIAEKYDWMCAVVFERAIAALEQQLEASELEVPKLEAPELEVHEQAPGKPTTGR
jgi:hypothetical protein